MSKFKIGDRVVVAVDHPYNDAKLGQVGTVLEDSSFPWIVFDDPTGRGKDYAHATVEGWKGQHMDCIPEDQLSPYKGKSMNKPHKWHKEIVAFAEGKDIQLRSCDDDWWFDYSSTKRFPNFNDQKFEFRIKPKTIRYRVALMVDCDGCPFPELIANSENLAARCERLPEFIRWLTDWQEAEVES